MSICQYCQNAAFWAALPLVDRERSPLRIERPSHWGDNLTIDHCSSAAGLVRSALFCPLCEILSKCIIEDETRLHTSAHWAVKLACAGEQGSLATQLRVELWNIEEQSFVPYGRPDHKIAICGQSDTLAGRIIWRSKIPDFTSRIQVIRDWLRHCLRDHHQCRLGNAPLALPSRFLDLGTGGIPACVKLIYSRDVVTPASRVSYVALSHCWGASPESLFKTTKASHDSNLVGIAVKDLPKTFRDAINVTAALGIRYLWIDSLCIVQDDTADWAAEATKMADVYQGAWFTIAATSSLDGNGGLFLDSFVPATRVTLDATSSSRDFSSEGPAQPPHTCLVRHPVASRSTITDAHLSRRAWVLQEQVLSARLIHFTRTQMFYQCHGGLESEDGTLKEEGFTSILAMAPSAEFNRESMGARDLQNKVRAMDSWWSWVAEYSSRSLTFPSDRMPAIAGIVEYYRLKTKDDTIVGLWKSTIWYDLAWQINERRIGRVKDAPQQRLLGTPTWSWLCLSPTIPVMPMLILSSQRSTEYQRKAECVSWRPRWEGEAYTSKLVEAELVVASVGLQLGSALPVPRGKEPRVIDFEAEWDEFLAVHIVLDFVLDEAQRQDVLLFLLFADPIYEYVLVLEEDKSHEAGMAYRRLGAGLINRPRGHAGFFKDATRIQLRLV